MRKYLVLTCLFIAGCGGGSVSSVTREIREPSEPYRILLPTRSRGPMPLVLYCHGSGESADAIVTCPNKAPIIQRFLDAGCVVAASDAHGKAWGNDTSLADYAELYNYCRAKYGTSGTVVFGQSMGGVPGLLLVAKGLIPDARCFVGIDPACSPGAVHWPEVAEAYVGAPPAANEPLLYTYSIPMLLYASYDDVTIPRSEHADKLAALVGTSVIDVPGGHGVSSHYRADEILAFALPLVE